MIYRLIALTPNDDQYELWAHDETEARQKLINEKIVRRGNKSFAQRSIIMTYGSVPEWCTLTIWSKAVTICKGDERRAKDLLWLMHSRSAE